ncbi:hypothetical protein Ancab_024114 [Ancistrocladus abbreviatus]
MKQRQTRSKTNGFLPSSIKIISSCIKTVSSGVRSASATVAATVSSNSEDHRDQVLWACFDRLELGPSKFKRVLLLGYANGFQVLDVDEASNVSELVSRRDDPCTFLQTQPIPAKAEDREGFRASHPLLLVVAGEEAKGSDPLQRRRDGFMEPQTGNIVYSPTAVRFYSMRSHNYVHVLRFRSAVYMVRCSPRIIAVGLASQIYCFDALTLESLFSVLTYPVPQLGGPGMGGINIGYGPMDVGPRWLAYASNNPLLTSTGRLSPQSLTSPGASPSTSPSSGSLVARYAMESSKQLAAGLINLGDMGYKTLSKYCQELIPDGPSSPVISSSGWKVGKASSHSAETDTAGMVVIKDFVSRTVVSQFRAHTSPISALCFDPSGTLLVTASIHGNNINIFRIMPSCLQNGVGGQSYNWTSSHVHLYKLHRGITSAVIQDICFSHYSQWVAIVSSKGTCHIYVLSPFGGESGLQVNSFGDGPPLSLSLSLPWWSTSSATRNEQPFLTPPPAPVTLSVVSRIRTGNSGWLNTVSNAASSAAGMVSMPSGAVSAVFHSSIPHDSQRGGSKMASLEKLLVYSPSGHLIQYELLPSVGGELTGTSRTGSGSLAPMQDEELRVKSEPVQWWDVCRRADWPEREECITGLTLGGNSTGIIMDASDCEDNCTSGMEEVKHPEQPHWYLSNAEVQMSYWRIPIWQNSKMHFCTMSILATHEQKFSEDYIGGEIEIEKVAADHKVEIKRKDLLPVFNSSRSVQSDGSDGGSAAREYRCSQFETHTAEEKYFRATTMSSSELLSAHNDQNLKNGSIIPSQALVNTYQPVSPPLAEMNGKRSYSIVESPSLTQGSNHNHVISTSIDTSMLDISSTVNNYLVNSPSLKNVSLSSERAVPQEAQSSNSVGTSDSSNISSNRSDFSMNLVDEGSGQDSLDFGQYFQEEYCKASPPDDCRDMTEVVMDVDSSNSPRDKDKSEEDEETDESLVGMFAFSEEG